jgi:hypothetical protein
MYLFNKSFDYCPFGQHNLEDGWLVKWPAYVGQMALACLSSLRHILIYIALSIAIFAKKISQVKLHKSHGQRGNTF